MGCMLRYMFCVCDCVLCVFVIVCFVCLWESVLVIAFLVFGMCVFVCLCLCVLCLCVCVCVFVFV